MAYIGSLSLHHITDAKVSTTEHSDFVAVTLTLTDTTGNETEINLFAQPGSLANLISIADAE